MLATVVALQRDGVQGVLTEMTPLTVGEERALVVFDRRATAQRFREDTGRYGGYGIVGVDEARIAALLARTGLRLIVMPEVTEDGEWSFATNFRGCKFLEILEVGIKK